MIKYLKYLSYVLRHKYYVFLECLSYGIIWRGITHDLSKFRPDEFIPYARYFYGEYPDWNDIKRRSSTWSYKFTKQGIEQAFDIAWLKHQHRNPHHWQYWILREDSGNTKMMDIPLSFINEMVADWKGAGRAIKRTNNPDEVIGWYLDNYNKIQLSTQSRIIINDMLHIAHDKGHLLYAGASGLSR